MTKKFVALTMVLVLVAGVGALAADDEDRPFYGTWENTLTLDPNQEADYNADNPFRLDSTLEATYTAGGLTFTGEAVFDYDTREGDELPEESGLTDVEFGMETSVGLLDLTSTVNFNVQTPGLNYWVNQATLTLGGVSITDTFVLQDTKAGADEGFGAGMDLAFSGETPGGVSVTVNNYFGMEPVMDIDGGIWGAFYPQGLISGTTFDYNTLPYASGYHIMTDHDLDGDGDGRYGPSSMQYVATMLTLDNLSLACCDFSSETLFSEANGFEYTEFAFTIESESLPISLDGWLTFTAQTKSLYLEPSITTDWACFTVYSGLITGEGTEDNVLAANSENESVIHGFEIRGFGLTGVELGHVEFSAYAALGGNDLYDMTQDLTFYPYGSYNELIRIEKLEKYPLDFTLDTYFDMSNGGLFDLALFVGDMEYELDDEFTIGTGLEVEPDGGLQEFSFTFDYSF